MGDLKAIGEELAGWGKVALLETRGRRSGRPQLAAVGFVEDDDGSLLVAAGSYATDWARNLQANNRCRATIGDESGDYRAHEVEGSDKAHALTELILKYGTPAERLGHGPVFRLRPATD